MASSVKVSGTWRPCTYSVRVGGAWKTATHFARVGGVWKATGARVAEPATQSVTFPGAPGDMTAYVVLTCATSGATIYTSVNGGSWTAYSGTVTVSPGSSLRAYAGKSGYTDSTILGPMTYY